MERIKSGTASVQKEEKEKAEVLAGNHHKVDLFVIYFLEMTAGQMFGEMSVLSRQGKVSASIR